MSKRNYINPSVVHGTMRNLEAYAKAHPESKMPMTDAAKEFGVNTEYDRACLLCAARRLGWDVHKTRGHVYENGFFAW